MIPESWRSVQPSGRRDGAHPPVRVSPNARGGIRAPPGQPVPLRLAAGRRRRGPPRRCAGKSPLRRRPGTRSQGKGGPAPARAEAALGGLRPVATHEDSDRTSAMPVATVTMTRGKPGHVPLRGLSALHPVARAECLRWVRLGDGGRRAGHCWGGGRLGEGEKRRWTALDSLSGTRATDGRDEGKEEGKSEGWGGVAVGGADGTGGRDGWIEGAGRRGRDRKQRQIHRPDGLFRDGTPASKIERGPSPSCVTQSLRLEFPEVRWPVQGRGRPAAEPPAAAGPGRGPC